MGKSGAPLRGGTKMANWCVKEFDRISIRSSSLSCHLAIFVSIVNAN